MSQLTILALFRAKVGRTQALGIALSALVDLTRAEPECLNNVDPSVGQSARLAGIISEKPNAADAKVMQDCGRQVKIPAVGFELQGMIGRDRIKAGVLERVGLQLRHQADAAALLKFIDDECAAFIGNGLHGYLQLIFAVTAQ